MYIYKYVNEYIKVYCEIIKLSIDYIFDDINILKCVNNILVIFC